MHVNMRLQLQYISILFPVYSDSCMEKWKVSLKKKYCLGSPNVKLIRSVYCIKNMTSKFRLNSNIQLD